MNKYEFLVRFSMIDGIKLTKFKKYAYPLDDEIDDSFLLKQLLLDQSQIDQFYQQDVDKILEWIVDDNHFLIDFHDAKYPELLRQINSAPLLLFGLGDANLLNTPQIAMVGSRNFSEYGAQWARYFASELAINGLTITSGLALGIDAISHRGALEVSGKTIAVLGSGLSHITPRTNRYLAQDILAMDGAIISEFLPFEKARAEYYPRRNRIISGLSLGTFVVEASEKSGSLITARYALEQNRDIFALPGDINNHNSFGVNWLIKQGAYLVSNPTDILEHYSGSLSWLKQQSKTEKTENLNIIHPDIFAVIHNQPIHINMIAEKLGQPVTDVSIKLIELELEGLIRAVSGGYIRNQIL